MALLKTVAGGGGGTSQMALFDDFVGTNGDPLSGTEWTISGSPSIQSNNARLQGSDIITAKTNCTGGFAARGTWSAATSTIGNVQIILGGTVMATMSFNTGLGTSGGSWVISGQRKPNGNWCYFGTGNRTGGSGGSFDTIATDFSSEGDFALKFQINTTSGTISLFIDDVYLW